MQIMIIKSKLKHLKIRFRSLIKPIPVKKFKWSTNIRPRSLGFKRNEMNTNNYTPKNVKISKNLKMNKP